MIKKSLFQGRPTASPENPEKKPGNDIIVTKHDKAVEKTLNKSDLKLGIWEGIKFNRRTQSALGDITGNIAIALVKKQESEITQRLMLDLDMEKKKAFADYLRNVKSLNSELTLQSAEMERELRTALTDELGKIYAEQEEWLKKIDTWNLSPKDRDAELSRMEGWIELAKQQADGKIYLLIEKFSKALQETLELLESKAIRGDDGLN